MAGVATVRRRIAPALIARVRVPRRTAAVIGAELECQGFLQVFCVHFSRH
ncbi:hypothetical protein GL4_0537 [Methyloceanibacter caenitepidi]|uniref:Uncharacterized protein n=1 Tax=Methyloceanibacter caenitepidi TaxID=1384459 RepID=A0A0A8K0G7_9HYPH|nr:hypothetical protein GL4_0537 [Methyloceanibacter caenitepidi]